MGWPLCLTVSTVMRGCSLYTLPVDGGDGDKTERKSAVCSTSTGSETCPELAWLDK